MLRAFCTPLLIACFFVVTLEATARNKVDNGFVSVSSQFFDEGTKKNITIKGSGFIFEVPSSPKTKLFLLSASHVTQGSNIAINDQALSPSDILGRSSNVLSDIEIIELPSGKFTAGAFWNYRERRIFLNEAQFKFFKRNPKMLLQTEIGPNPALVPMGNWIAPGAVPFKVSDERSSFNSNVMYTGWNYKYLASIAATGEVFSSAKISPGMSGSPLLAIVRGYNADSIKTSAYAIIGITTRYLRNFIGSWFAGSDSIARLLEDYLSQVKAPPSGTWRLWNGLSYREFPNGYVETFVEHLASGNGTVGQGGNQDRGDGGNQDRGDGGNFKDAWNPEWWEKQKISSGMRMGEKNIIGFNFLQYGNFSADIEAIAIAKRFKAELIPIPINTNYVDLLVQKVAKGYLRFDLARFLNETNNVPQFKLRSIVSSDSLGSGFVIDKDKIWHPEQKENPLLIVDKDRIKISFRGPLPQQEKISFVLNTRGILENSKSSYRPVIRVKGELGGNYLVDINRIFFMDPGVAKRAHESWPYHLYPRDHAFDFTDSLVTLKEDLSNLAHEGPCLTFRPEQSSTSNFEISFSVDIQKLEPSDHIK